MTGLIRGPSRIAPMMSAALPSPRRVRGRALAEQRTERKTLRSWIPIRIVETVRNHEGNTAKPRGSFKVPLRDLILAPHNVRRYSGATRHFLAVLFVLGISLAEITTEHRCWIHLSVSTLNTSEVMGSPTPMPVSFAALCSTIFRRKYGKPS